MDILLFGKNNPAAIFADKSDWDGVHIALEALRGDIKLVTGAAPAIQLDGAKIIAGTIGKSPIIDALAASGKIDTTAIAGKWECFLLQIVDNPAPGVDIALVVAGSDKRGTIYGIYEFSRLIGVSPWVWWGDSQPAQQETITLAKNFRQVNGEPSVKYRGFFMNDEAPSLSGWMGKHFPKVANPQATQGCGSQFYTKIFELLLRLRGNYLWPVMWNNSFHTDDPQNTIMADKYGVVMGTSHHEHMTCADKEWSWSGLGQWNYATNRDKIYKFWQDGTAARKPYESIITLGMRGQADSAILGPNATLKDNMDLMQGVLTDQRKIIKTVHGAADAAPQMIALYKEVEDFYYGDDVNGKLNVPEDVTLMLCDDNFGNIRTLPTPEMLKRPGGFGMYYHFDYRGGPISYEWINQVPITKTWDQMSTAYEAGVRQIWIVNVGDLKPMEFPLDYFMALAYDYDTWGKPNKTKEFTLNWATREFGGEFAAAVEEVVSGHLKILGARKAEVVLPSTFALDKFNEAERTLHSFEAIVKKAEAIYEKLPQQKQATFYQMVLYPTRAAYNVYAVGIYTAFSHHYAQKGYNIANDYAEKARLAFQKDAEETEYYNKTLSNGKWDGIMRQNHMAYTQWNSPHIQVVPETLPELGKIEAGSNNPADHAAPPAQAPQLSLPKNTYIETDGYVSINPASFVKTTPSPNAAWTVIQNYGREFDSIKTLPHTANPGSPAVEYSFYLQNPGEYNISIFLAPNNNPLHETITPLNQQLRFSVQIDSGETITTPALPEKFVVGYGPWAMGVMNNVRVKTIPYGQLNAGQHSLTIKAIDPGVVIQKIVIAPPCARQEMLPLTPPTEHFMGSYFGPPESPKC
ncbi:MAG: glycosyl hydrolase 115 family protein [Defluviitaleaceae bacterium]|nr:glycosyl hydrolase 115 family protein [Defluviitaleaceae bacterium]